LRLERLSVDGEELLKKYREMNTALRYLRESGCKRDKNVDTIRGYAYALRNLLLKLGFEPEPIEWP